MPEKLEAVKASVKELKVTKNPSMMKTKRPAKAKEIMTESKVEQRGKEHA